MPQITAAGTYTHKEQGLEDLRGTRGPYCLLFSGTSLGSSCLIQYIDDQGNAATFEDGDISSDSLPVSKVVNVGVTVQLVTTGTPDFNVTVAPVSSA